MSDITKNAEPPTPSGDVTKDRQEVADKYGIPEHLLRGDTRAQLEEHATQLADAGITTENAKSAAEIVDGILGRTSTATEPKPGEELTADQTVSKALGR